MGRTFVLQVLERKGESEAEGNRVRELHRFCGRLRSPGIGIATQDGTPRGYSRGGRSAGLPLLIEGVARLERFHAANELHLALGVKRLQFFRFSAARWLEMPT